MLASPPVAQHLRKGSEKPPNLTTHPLVQASQPLLPVLFYDVYQQLSFLHHILPSWFPSIPRLIDSDLLSRVGLLSDDC